jgi:hypothetical protein
MSGLRRATINLSRIAVLVAFLFFPANAQTITSIAQQFTVTGTGFVSGSTVMAGGSACPTTFVSATELTALCPIGAALTVANPPPPCFTVPLNTWSAKAFAAQTAPFEIQFDATPSTANQDGVFGLGALPATAYNGMNVLGRFNDTGTIDFRNGASYVAVTPVPYSAGGTYHITIDVTPGTSTFNAYVGPTATRVAVATNYSFRTDGPAVTNFANLSANVDEGAAGGTLTFCNMTVAPYHTVSLAASIPIEPSGVTAVNFYRGTTQGGPYTTKVGTVTLATPTTAFTDTTVAAGVTYYYVATTSIPGGAESGYSPVATATIPTP